jgi:hypothetical protein
MVPFSSIPKRSDRCATGATEAIIADRAETIGTKEPPSSTTLLHMPTAPLQCATAKRITGPRVSFRGRRWNTRPRLTSIPKKLIENPESPPAKQATPGAPNPRSGPRSMPHEVSQINRFRTGGAGRVAGEDAGSALAAPSRSNSKEPDHARGNLGDAYVRRRQSGERESTRHTRCGHLGAECQTTRRPISASF